VELPLVPLILVNKTSKALLYSFLTLVFSFSASADSIQDCLDQISQDPKNPPTGLSDSVMTYAPVTVDKLNNRCDEQGSLEDVKQALNYQLESCRRRSPDGRTHFQIACREYSRDEWCLQTTEEMLALAESAPDFKTFLQQVRTEFDWYQSSGLSQPSPDGKFSAGQTQVTGYYSPLIKASRTRQGSFKYPIYGRPDDLVESDPSDPEGCGYNWCLKNVDDTLSPYYTKEEIDNGALTGEGLEIAYVEDPIDVAFMMVQGSASLDIQNKSQSDDILRLSYAAQNGRKLYMLGRVIKCDGGKVEDYSSMNGIRNYLHSHPEKIKKLLHYDQSYIFFEEVDDGPIGFEGVPVTGMHSIAVDRSQVPMGISTLIDVQKSVPATDCAITSSFAVAQDVGGAISGAHFDWFQGTGEEAEARAGGLDNPGWFYIGLKKGLGHPVGNCLKATDKNLKN